MIRPTTWTAAPIRTDRGEPAVAVVAYPAGKEHPFTYLCGVDDALELADKLTNAADQAQAAYGALADTEPPDDDSDGARHWSYGQGAALPEPGSPEDLALWPPAGLEGSEP